MVPSRSTDLCHSFSAHNLPDFLCTTLPRKSTSFVFENESIPEGITIEQFVAVLLVLVYLLVVVARFFSGRKKPYVKTQENIPYIPQQDTINEHSLKLIVKVQARIRAYLARKQYMHRIYKEMAVDQIFRFDISIRRLIYGNHEKFFSIYKQYIVFPAQAIDRAGTLKLAQDFSIVPNVCNRRELNDAVDRVTNKNKNFSPGGPVLLSFQNFLELFILLSLRHVHSSSKDEAVYKFDTLLKIIESSGGHAKVSKQRSTTLVKRFTLLESGELPSADVVRNIDLWLFQSKKSFRTSPTSSAKKISRKSSKEEIKSGTTNDEGGQAQLTGELSTELEDLDVILVNDDDLTLEESSPQTPSPAKKKTTPPSQPKPTNLPKRKSSMPRRNSRKTLSTTSPSVPEFSPHA